MDEKSVSQEDIDLRYKVRIPLLHTVLANVLFCLHYVVSGKLRKGGFFYAIF